MKQKNQISDSFEDKQALLNLDIDSFEIESFVTGLSEDEKDAINKDELATCKCTSDTTPPPHSCM